MLADSSVVTPALLQIAKDQNRSRDIRRSAITYRVPCITTLSGARAAADAVAAKLRDPIRVWSLQEIHASKVDA